MMEAIHFSEVSVLKKPHHTPSQKMVFFTVTAVKTSDVTYLSHIFGIDIPVLYIDCTDVLSCKEH
jgi:hypothetical protein